MGRPLFHIGYRRVIGRLRQSSASLHPSQAVRKAHARLKYSVHLYKAKSGFSILTEECLTFQTVSPPQKKTAKNGAPQT